MTGIENLFFIGAVPGYSEQVSHLVSMLNFVRHGTISAVEKLTVQELEYLPHKNSNSIGSLLLHIAAAEIGYQAATFYNRQVNTEEKNAWGNYFSLDSKSNQEIKGHPIHYYLEKLEQVRQITLTELSIRDDAWLLDESRFGENKKINNYFKWFHVLTHEVNHRGQIRTLIREAKLDLNSM